MRTALISILILAGCGSDDGGTCGPGTASPAGAVLAGNGGSDSYSGLTAGANGDCPAASAPTSVKSLTITGKGGTSADLITVCIPRPDELDGVQTLTGNATADPVQFVDLDATIAGCTLSLMTGAGPTGTVTGAGVCDNGTSSAGFALTFAVTAAMQLDCAGAISTTTAMLTGSVAVAAAQL